jgi:hypothetical protein
MPINWGQSQSEIAEATTIAIKQLNRVVDVFDLSMILGLVVLCPI